MQILHKNQFVIFLNLNSFFIFATFKGDSMNIKVLFNNPYNGVIHARDNRTPTCMAYGNGNNLVTMSLNLRVPSTSPDYCGIFVNTVSLVCQKKIIE